MSGQHGAIHSLCVFLKPFWSLNWSRHCSYILCSFFQYSLFKKEQLANLTKLIRVFAKVIQSIVNYHEMYAFVYSITSLAHFVLLVISTVSQLRCQNEQHNRKTVRSAEGLLERFTANQDMPLLPNCPEIQVHGNGQG